MACTDDETSTPAKEQQISGSGEKNVCRLTDFSASLTSLSWRLLSMQEAMAEVTSMVLVFSRSSAFQALLLALMFSICCEERGVRRPRMIWDGCLSLPLKSQHGLCPGTAGHVFLSNTAGASRVPVLDYRHPKRFGSRDGFDLACLVRFLVGPSSSTLLQYFRGANRIFLERPCSPVAYFPPSHSPCETLACCTCTRP